VNDPRALSVIDYWLAGSTQSPVAALERHAFWYRADAAVDAEIRRRFVHLLDAALDGDLDEWQASAEGSLALIIVLDQFTRNIYRGTPDAYRGDGPAWHAADRAVGRNQHTRLPLLGSLFLLHPFHHSEQLAQQDRGVHLLRALTRVTSEEWQPYLHRSVEGFTKHRDIVARFGRFPHRNRSLGRTCTAEETVFLEGGANTFGQ
jgi:uncharacterized protein (DUF924 family)